MVTLSALRPTLNAVPVTRAPGLARRQPKRPLRRMRDLEKHFAAQQFYVADITFDIDSHRAISIEQQSRTGGSRA